LQFRNNFLANLRKRAQFSKFYVVHTLPMSDFCIYTHSGTSQGVKGLIW
jgi:hypothetical protein